MASASAVEWTATVAMPSSLAGAQDAQRDLAAVGDQDLVEHRLLDDHQRLAVFDRLAVLDQDAVTVPARGATISLKVFIASMSSTLSPTFTSSRPRRTAWRPGEGGDRRCRPSARCTAPGWGAPARPVAAGAAARARGRRGRRTAAERSGAAATGTVTRRRSAGRPDAKVALLDLDLGEIRLGEELRELADELGIEGVVLGHGARLLRSGGGRGRGPDGRVAPGPGIRCAF